MAKRILLFGGSFDPPHEGHRRLLATGLKALRPDRAYLLPAFHSPLKTKHSASAADRLRMAELLLSGVPGARRVVRVHDWELSRGRKTYTVEAARHFKARHPDAELWFLAGTDALATLDRWKRPEELRRSLRWLTGRRPGPGTLPRGLQARMLPGRFPGISSTQLRARLLAGLACPEIPPSVLAYIRRRGLYGLEIHRELKESLNPERYRHTLGVARLALELARRHCMDEEAAALAGLLHDCGRRFDLSAMVREARRRRIKVPNLPGIERHAPILAHAYLSADLARRRFGVQDARVLSAIRNHTLGAAGMPRFDRLLYAADIASEDREFPEAAKIRRLAFLDLDAAFAEAVRTKVRYVTAAGQWLHPNTAALWNWARAQGSAA